jgi:predicted Mrr-cat superfamily restriction endonuclease
MVRCNGGLWYEDFRYNDCVYIGKWHLGNVDFEKATKERIREALIKKGRTLIGAGKIAAEIKRYLFDVKPEDFVITATASSRKFAIGRIKGKAVNEKRKIRSRGQTKLIGDYVYSRPVEWISELNGYDLTDFAKASLWPKQAVFEVREGFLAEVLSLISAGKTRRFYKPGPESKEHKELKKYIKDNPEVLGIKNVKDTQNEYAFISGDRVDVYFECKGGKYAVVEVETTYPKPGFYQALKYRVLLSAQIGEDIKTRNVQAYLTAWYLDDELKELGRKYGVITKEVKL